MLLIRIEFIFIFLISYKKLINVNYFFVRVFLFLFRRIDIVIKILRENVGIKVVYGLCFFLR